jgi:hypothetical protein
VKPRARYVIAALAVSATAATLLPSRLDGLTSSRWHTATPATPARATGGTATLVDVKVTTAADNSEPAQRDALRSPARRRVAGASCTSAGAGTSAYSLEGSRVAGPTTAHVNTRGAVVAGAATVLQYAFNAWKSADPNAPTITVASDGTATSPSSNHLDEIMFGRLGLRTLGITYTWHWSTGEYESDIVFNTNVPWFQPATEGSGCYQGVNAYDFQSAATHEIGHLYGLGHVPSLYNTMYYAITKGETYKRSPATGDALGLRAIYG